MRLIIKEYISYLKEKDELDLLINEIFTHKGYISKSLPKTGNRQYGVDLQLSNDEELLFLVIKQKNIDRTNWDNGPNSVRQSLNEIRDVKFRYLNEDDKRKNIKIIVATNGYIDESIQMNWDGYVSENQIWYSIPIKIEFMNIDDIVKEIQYNFFNEYLFDEKLHSFLRKALYFIGESNYKKNYYEQIIDKIINDLLIEENLRITNKLSSALNLITQMICQYAVNEGNIKIAINISEYLIIKYWKYISDKNLFESKCLIEWLIKFCKNYERWNDLYLKKIEKITNQEAVLPLYNTLENRVMIYEILGYLSSYGNYLMNINEKKAKEVMNTIIKMIDMNSSFLYPPYDVNINIIIMIFKLLYYLNRKSKMLMLIENHLTTAMSFYKYNKKFPAPLDSFEQALEIEFENEEVKYDSSVYWGYLLMFIAVLGTKEMYNYLKNFLNKNLNETTKQVWFMRKEEEQHLYLSYAMNNAGEGIEIILEDDFDIFKEKVKCVLKQYTNENFTFDVYNFSSLEIIICRYYNYIPRINFLLKNEERTKNE